MMIINKKFPPYGKKLFEFYREGIKPSNDIFIFLGDDAWKRAKLFLEIHWTTLLLNDSKPNEYRWDFVRGSSVLIFDTSEVGSEIIRHLAYELLRWGATRVVVILVNYTLIVFRQGNDL